MRAREDGRKRRYRKDLRTLDKEAPEYWNEVLRRAGLYENEVRSIGAGQNHKLECWGTSQASAEVAQRARYQESGHRVNPAPAQA